MIPEFTDEATFADLLNPALAIAKERNHEEARAYFDAYVDYLCTKIDDMTLEKAAAMVRSNLGYWAGYFGREEREAVAEVFGAMHPVFGSDLSPSVGDALSGGARLMQGGDDRPPT